MNGLQLVLVIVGAIAVNAFAQRKGGQPALVITVVALAASFIPGVPRLELDTDVILGVVLIGTLYPIVAAGFGVQLSVGPPFFDKAAGPVALALVVVMAAGPLLRWRRDGIRAVAARLAVPGAAFVAALLAVIAFGGGVALLPLLGLALAAGLALG